MRDMLMKIGVGVTLVGVFLLWLGVGIGILSLVAQWNPLAIGKVGILLILLGFGFSFVVWVATDSHE
jgi:hypothetical protein